MYQVKGFRVPITAHELALYLFFVKVFLLLITYFLKIYLDMFGSERPTEGPLVVRKNTFFHFR